MLEILYALFSLHSEPVGKNVSDSCATKDNDNDNVIRLFLNYSNKTVAGSAVSFIFKSHFYKLLQLKCQVHKS